MNVRVRRRGRPTKQFDPNDKATKEWLNAQTRLTKKGYGVQMRRIIKFTGMNGNEMLADRINDKTHKWEKTVLAMLQHMKKKGLGDLSARQTTIALRSFFAFHRVPLTMRSHESRRLTKGRRKTEDYRFSREDLVRMDAIGNTEEKYIVTVGKSFGLRAGDFLHLTRGHFDALDLEQKPPISIGEYATEKEDVIAYPFIDTDALPVIKMLLAKMSREGRTDASERMLKYKNTTELTRVVKRLAKRAGIEQGNKRIRFHTLRKFLIDRLSDVMSESKWKQIVGKAISEGEYVTAERLRQDYARAMTETVYRKQSTEDEIEMRAAQRALEMTLNMSVSMPPHIKERMLKKIRAVKRIEELKPIEVEVGRMNKQAQHEGGVLSFEQQGAKAIARMFTMAMQELKEEIKKDD
jgi:integrase